MSETVSITLDEAALVDKITDGNRALTEGLVANLGSEFARLHAAKADAEARASRAEAKSETLGKMIRMGLAGASAAEVRAMAGTAPAE